MSKTTKRDREHAKWVRSIANKPWKYSKARDKAHLKKLVKLALPGWEGATVAEEQRFGYPNERVRVFTLGNASIRIYVDVIKESLERWV